MNNQGTGSVELEIYYWYWTGDVLDHVPPGAFFVASTTSSTVKVGGHYQTELPIYGAPCSRLPGQFTETASTTLSISLASGSYVISVPESYFSVPAPGVPHREAASTVSVVVR